MIETNLAGRLEIQFIGTDGTVHLATNIDRGLPVDVTPLTPGGYYYQVLSGIGVYTGKVVVVR